MERTFYTSFSLMGWIVSLQWRHNERDNVSNHQPHDCLLNRLFWRRTKKTWKLHVTGLCAGNSPGNGEFPAQRTSNAENASIWWRHDGFIFRCESDKATVYTTYITLADECIWCRFLLLNLYSFIRHIIGLLHHQNNPVSKSLRCIFPWFRRNRSYRYRAPRYRRHAPELPSSPNNPVS